MKVLLMQTFSQNNCHAALLLDNDKFTEFLKKCINEKLLIILKYCKAVVLGCSCELMFLQLMNQRSWNNSSASDMGKGYDGFHTS